MRFCRSFCEFAGPASIDLQRLAFFCVLNPNCFRWFGHACEHTKYIASTIPGAGPLILPDASHFAFLQDSEHFNDAVLGFLGGR
jgi:hypothetical protein